MMKLKLLEKKSLIIVLLLIIVILVLLVNIYLKMINESNYNHNDQEDFNRIYNEETILPRNIGELYGYSGVNNTDDLFRSLKSFSNYIFKIKNKFKNTDNIEEYKKYFIENKQEVLAYTSISSEEKFVQFVNYIKKYNVNKEEFKYAEIVSGSSEEKNNYYWVSISFYYGDNNEEIKFDVGLAERENNKIIVKYDFKL